MKNGNRVRVEKVEKVTRQNAEYEFSLYALCEVKH